MLRRIFGKVPLPIPPMTRAYSLGNPAEPEYYTRGYNPRDTGYNLPVDRRPLPPGYCRVHVEAAKIPYMPEIHGPALRAQTPCVPTPPNRTYTPPH